MYRKLEEIDNVLQGIYPKETNIGVLGGISGMSIFQFYYSKLLKVEEGTDIGVDMLFKCIGQINKGYAVPTFCTGIAGVGWTIEFLTSEGFIDFDSDSLLSELDGYLSISMDQNIEEEYFDFLHGAIGYAYYFLKRYEGTKSETLKEKYKNYLLKIIQALNNTAENEGEFTWWKSNSNQEKETDGVGVNLSLSHGMASIINFLCRLHQFDEFRHLVDDQLKRSTAYILNLKAEIDQAAVLFPNYIMKGEKKNKKTRLAWCYGDLGVGITLWRVGKTLKNEDYKNTAIEIIKHTTKRRDENDTRVFDAGLCHGASGLVLMYRYMYNETHQLEFNNAANFWMNRVVEMAVHEEGYAGFQEWNAVDAIWRPKVDVLSGIAGIGLAIISYLAPFETKWDECMMIN